jgi:hypothetical protein
VSRRRTLVVTTLCQQITLGTIKEYAKLHQVVEAISARKAFLVELAVLGLKILDRCLEAQDLRFFLFKLCVLLVDQILKAALLSVMLRA